MCVLWVFFFYKSMWCWVCATYKKYWASLELWVCAYIFLSVCFCSVCAHVCITMVLVCVWGGVRVCVCVSNLPWPRGFSRKFRIWIKSYFITFCGDTHTHTLTLSTLHFKLIIFHPSDKSNTSPQKKNREKAGVGRQTGHAKEVETKKQNWKARNENRCEDKRIGKRLNLSCYHINCSAECVMSVKDFINFIVF